jgi:hypothetical protein
VRAKSSFSPLHLDKQFLQHYLLKKLSFLQCMFLVSLSKMRWLYVCGLICGFSILFHFFMGLFLWQYHVTFAAVVLWYIIWCPILWYLQSCSLCSGLFLNDSLVAQQCIVQFPYFWILFVAYFVVDFKFCSIMVW